MIKCKFPNNLKGLHEQEQSMRAKAIAIVETNPKLLLHLNAVERAMTLAKLVVDFPTEDEDFKVIKLLSTRMFNAFGASQALMFSGYHQKSAMVMRDTLETLFLMDFFRTDHIKIEQWRLADEKMRRKMFSPASIRKALDERDGFDTKKREKTYKMFCDLAAHPNMHSQHMLRPEKDEDMVIGPFMSTSILDAGISELGRLAVQAGEIMDLLLPQEYDVESVRASFADIKKEWVETFYR